MSQPRVVGAANGFDAQPINVATAECNKTGEFTLPRKHCGVAAQGSFCRLRQIRGTYGKRSQPS
jgi:hypothetical protein